MKRCLRDYKIVLTDAVEVERLETKRLRVCRHPTAVVLHDPSAGGYALIRHTDHFEVLKVRMRPSSRRYCIPLFLYEHLGQPQYVDVCYVDREFLERNLRFRRVGAIVRARSENYVNGKYAGVTRVVIEVEVSSLVVRVRLYDELLKLDTTSYFRSAVGLLGCLAVLVGAYEPLARVLSAAILSTVSNREFGWRRMKRVRYSRDLFERLFSSLQEGVGPAAALTLGSQLGGLS